MSRIPALDLRPLRQRGGRHMEPLPAELPPAVSHVTFSLFNLALPNLIVVGIVVVSWAVAVWARLPRFVELSGSESRGGQE